MTGVTLYIENITCAKMSQVQRNLHTSGRLSDRCAHHSFHKQQRHAGGRVGGRKSAMNIGHACSSYQVYGNQRSTSSVTDITRCSLPTRAHELDKPRLIITRAAHDDFDEIDDFSSQNDDNLSDKERLQLVFNTALEDDLYLALGRAHCFAMNKGGGKLDEKIIVEPIGAAGLEAMSKGMATSYTHVFGSTLGHARKMLLDATENKDFQEHLPKEFQGAELAENFEARCEAATRTWDRPHPRETLMYVKIDHEDAYHTCSVQQVRRMKRWEIHPNLKRIF